jgi:23S rRNA (guanosine2251-2'-O)-methyltransferase
LSISFDTIVGRIPVLEALRSGKRRGHCLYALRRARDLDELRAEAKGLPIEEVDRDELDRLAEGVTHQGVVLRADPLPILGLKEWLGWASSQGGLVVVLDGVEDPRNFGAIVRSASACGASAVLFAKDRAAPLSPASVKAAAGAMEYMDLIRITNVSRSLQSLKDAGYWTAALTAEGDQVLWDADFRGPMALVIGNEGKGIRPLVLAQCDLKLRIPLQGPITSLNASVSAAIALAECMRQRLQ